jgi:osmotically-inducible protein OsmY
MNGKVKSYAEKLSVLRAASRVFGVRGVADAIIVRLPDYNERTDADIARSAANAIAWAAAVPADCVKVMVENGWVTLQGQVNCQFEREAAEASVRPLRGIVGISNEIIVRPIVETIDVKDRIEMAFERHAQIDAKNISVDVKGTKIVLHGTVSSCFEREEAERAAWATLGVTEVENDLVVDLR